MQTLTAQVTDTNHHPRGAMAIAVEFHADTPIAVRHDGQHYTSTGKLGINLKTGLPVREMATEDDTRLWISLDGQQVWED